MTVVLIGTYTAKRKYVRYEIQRSLERGNGLLGIYIHGIKDQRGHECAKGPNPFDHFATENDDFLTRWLWPTVRVSSVVPCYYWKDDNGRESLSSWIEESARRAGR